MDGQLYIMGGFSRLFINATNALSTLSSDGKFSRIHPSGDVPRPIFDHRAWSFDGKIFFFAGLIKETDGERKKMMTEWNQNPALFYSNNVHQYDLATNEFSSVTTTGTNPTPRKDFAVARVGSSSYIHGGWCNRWLNDFFALNLETMQWTKIGESGFQEGIDDHSLTKVSEKEILLVGGVHKYGVSDKVKLFNIDEQTWRVAARLPLDVAGGEEGLHRHDAIHVPNENGVFVFCVGGYVDLQWRNHPKRLVLFDIISEQ